MFCTECDWDVEVVLCPAGTSARGENLLSIAEEERVPWSEREAKSKCFPSENLTINLTRLAADMISTAGCHSLLEEVPVSK